MGHLSRDGGYSIAPLDRGGAAPQNLYIGGH
jgi:lysozyme family protein